MANVPRPADAVRIGEVFLGKYRVESILGQGGMGVVAECTHLALNERVAIKMLRQDVQLDRDALERFMREAQAAVKLKSEYVARVSDVGTFENGTPYMVMEFLEGQDLGALLQEHGHIAASWAVELMLQTAEALAEAHSLGIVHRDIKPSNLFVTWRPDGTSLIKVLDFGISKAPMGADMHLTQTQSVLGTPAYMSPEQMRSARLVDARTDIWSLGTVMYELLEGRKPFEAESFSEMCVKVALDPPEPMVHTPPALQAVVLRCLAKAPEQRYASMAELGNDLIAFSHAPHQASVLVERMQRMLRRSQPDWEGMSTGAGQLPAFHHGTDSASSASRPGIPRWQPGTNPSAPMLRTPLPGALVAQASPQADAARAPSLAPSEVYTVPSAPARRRALALVLLAGALVGIAAGVLLLDGDEDAAPEPLPDRRPVELEITTPTPGAVPSEPGVLPALDAAMPAVAEGSASGSADGSASGSGSGSGSADGSAAVQPGDAGSTAAPGTEHGMPGNSQASDAGKDRGAKTVRRSGKTGRGKSGGKAHAKKDPASPATSETPTPPKVTPKPPPCDPFASSRGCDTPRKHH